MGELNHSALQAAQEQDSENGADSNQGPESGDEVNTAVSDGVNTGASNRADMTKKPDCGNGVVAWPDDGANSSKRPISLDGVIGTLDQTDTGVGNKVDVGASDGADTRGNNGVGVTMGPDSEDRVVAGVESEVETGVSYRLDSLIPADDHAENFPSRNLADILANPFGHLSSTSIDFRSSLAFLISSSYLAASDSTSSSKPLDSTSPGGPATWNPGNILAFYHWLFAYLTVGPSTNVVSIDSSHLSSNSIEVE